MVKVSQAKVVKPAVSKIKKTAKPRANSKAIKPAASKSKKTPGPSVKSKVAKPAISKIKKVPETPVNQKVAKPVFPVFNKTKKTPETQVNSSAEERNFIAEKIGKKPGKPGKAATKKIAAPAPVAAVERNFIVGIGASAGGLEALSDLIRALPDDLGVPYIVVQHLSPTYRSMMVPLLARETDMLVKDVEDGETPMPNVIYVTPANWNIILKDGIMRLLVPGKTVLPKPSATVLFNSMAEDKGEDAIGVILSGTGSDGSAGISAIKAVGGFTFAQDPEAAKYSGMPQAAISTGCVEWVLTCKGIAEEITAIARAHGLIDRTPKLENSPATMKGLLQMVYKQSKIDFSGYKEATLSRRVERRMAANRLNNLAAYFDFCSKNPDELNKLSRDILISVTAFFRDRNSFEGLRKILAEIVADKQPGDEIRIWVPACATGEEAYSIGILLADILGGNIGDYRIQIFATDIDMEAMAVARKGIYTETSLAEVGQETITRYFSKKSDLYEIARPIRDMVVFARQDLVLDPPFLRLDLISCRNLLIYFQPLLQTRVLSIFHFALRPSAHLFLGKSESIVHQDNMFAPVSKEARIFKRVASKDQVIPIPLYSSKEAGVKAPITIAERGSRKQENKLQKALSEIYAPPSVLINRSMDVLEVHGDVQNYLHFPAGKLEMNLAQLLRREWRTEVQTLVHHADLKNVNATGRIRPIKNRAGHSIKIEVHPVVSRDDQKQFLVSFISLATLMDGSQVTDQPPVNNSEIEDELIATREHLQTVIEELETSNEELQALNEEMQAANEELQSSNEELEASNEELQSTNEELTTVNQELIVKGGELSLVNTELENLQNSTGFSLILLDQELRLQRYNKEAASVFGFSVHTLGKTISGLVLPVTEVLKTAQLAMSDGIKRRQQTSFGGKHYNVLCFPYTSRDQSLGGVIITFIDETELIAAQHEIQLSQERMVAMMQNSPMQISVKNTAGQYQFVNKAFGNMFGLEQRNVIGKSDTQVFPEPVSALFEKLHFDVLHKKMLVEAEERIDIDGRQHWFSFICYPLYDEHGSVMAVCSQSTDITERLQANEKLLKLSRAVESSPASVVITNIDGEIEYVNRRFVDVTGYTAGEAIGQNPRILKSGIQPPEFYEKMWASILAGKVWHGELSNKKKSGEIYQEAVSISPIHNEHGVLTHFVAVKEDITKRKQIELELQKAMDSADAANRAKGDFLANMSHEIRTPMNAIIGLSHLCMQTELSLKQRDYLQKVHGSAKSLLGIINDILEFSKIEAGKMDVEHVPFELEDVMRNLATVVSTKVEEKKLEFLIGTSPNIFPHLIGDSMRLGQVLINLTSNAIKFTDKGEVLVLTEIEEETADNVTLRFTVQDSGIGLTKEQSDKLFQAFSQADTTITRKFGGTGLGLSISKRIVGLMGGEIWVESVHGKGSKFIFTALFQKAAERRTGKRCIPDDSLCGMRVLVVDDNASCRHILQSYLKSFTFNVTLAANGVEALQALKQADLDGVPFQFVILDLDMPKMGGIEAARNIRAMDELSMTPKILLFSPFDQSEILRYLEANVVDGLLTKPFQQGELFDAVMAIFGYFDAIEMRSAVSALFSPNLVEKISGAYLLLVEDNEVNQQVARELLEKAGVAVAVAENGKEAVERVSQEAFDGVLMDIQMPVMDGISATREIRKNPSLANLPIIAMTANVMASDRERCLEAGMNDYIAKPFDPNQMVATLAKWIIPARPDASPSAHKSEAMPTSEALPILPGVQVSEGVHRVGGSVASYYAILEKFRNGQQNTFAETLSATAANDWDKAVRLVHTLKGLLGTLGAGRLKIKAAELEGAILDRENARIKSLLPAVNTELAQLFVFIDRALQLRAAKMEADDETAVPSGPVNMEELAGLIRQAMAQLKQFDSGVEDTMAKISDMVSGDPAMKKAIALIGQQMSGYNYEQGLVKLDAFAKALGVLHEE
ncbi:MAG: chemotaxis protein CheB [Sulfuricellaceae bacterium]